MIKRRILDEAFDDPIHFITSSLKEHHENEIDFEKSSVNRIFELERIGRSL